MLPRDHESGYGGWDRKNRVRQEAVDRAFMHPARVPEFLFEMLEQLEWRPGRDGDLEPVGATTTTASPPAASG